MPERIRAFGFAFLGLTAAAGLALVAVFAQMGFPLLSPAPLPSAPAEQGAVSRGVALGQDPATADLAQARGAAAAPSPSGRQSDSSVAEGTGNNPRVGGSADLVSGSEPGAAPGASEPVVTAPPAATPAPAPTPAATTPPPATTESTPAPVEVPVSSPEAGTKPGKSTAVVSKPDKDDPKPTKPDAKPAKAEAKPAKTKSVQPKSKPAKPKAKAVKPEAAPAPAASYAPAPAPDPVPQDKQDKATEEGKSK